MMNSVKTPFPECIKLLCENIKLDPYFKDFYKWSRENHVPVIVLSSGMLPIIRALLVHLVGPEANDIEIVCNEAVDRPPKTKDQEGGWQLKFHDDSDFGHDKSLTIRPYREHFEERPNDPRPIMLYAGDGVSDLSAARETDLLFAKRGHGKPALRTGEDIIPDALQTSSRTASAKGCHSPSLKTGVRSLRPQKPSCKPLTVICKQYGTLNCNIHREGKTTVKAVADESAEKAKMKKF